ncbi:bifunctional DNA-formamidopyrimidine glycosylase/DNA-(apurinic or apyrimidinic site) lyase [Candidatus Saccharibacteria bacterium]|nr:bifunctional DNA-formamidopyrimidine glycosylase/DNA-(apurinic or apyrimidinic site) lyase [Candidatus Saccharibacteria bacterium]
MPELPEVETIRRGLEERVPRKAGKILEVKVFEKKCFIGEPEGIIGTEVEKIERRGKALLIHFLNKKTAIVHLRMTGQLIWRGNYASGDIKTEDEGFLEKSGGVFEGTKKGAYEGEKSLIENSFAGGHPSENFLAELPNRQTRAVVRFEGGTLFFNDQRKFGFFKVVETERVGEDKFLAGLGKEPWEMTVEEFFEKLQRHRGAPIKAVILDQKNVAGLGNIYADEALFYAKIFPGRKAGEISREEAEKLLEGARVVMERSLEAGGSTIRNYVKSDGTRGDYLELFAEVFNREGKECVRCGEKIKKIRVAGRGTHYCPRCQELKGAGDLEGVRSSQGSQGSRGSQGSQGFHAEVKRKEEK